MLKSPEPHRQSLESLYTMAGKAHLGGSFYQSMSIFRKMNYIHIRHYAQNGDKLYATKQGVGLTLSRFWELRKAISQIELEIIRHDESETAVYFRRHLGGNWFVSLTQGYPCINIIKVKDHYWSQRCEIPVYGTGLNDYYPPLKLSATI